MRWTESIQDAIIYIEDNLTATLTIADIACKVCISPFYFQKGFAMLCGFTVAEYIRNRRLALAGIELVSSDNKIIDIAIKYGYESPESFTRAFTRFHGVTPTAVRKEGAMIKSFAALKIKLTLDGGYSMDYKIVEKEAFTIIGNPKVFRYDDAKKEIPGFWEEHYASGKGDIICGVYGINIDKSMHGNEFEYLIADNYNPVIDIPEGYVARVIPKHSWAVFACRGAMPHALQDVNQKIYSEWLPNCHEYEIAAGYLVEVYDDVSKYTNGTQDVNYYSELWVPIKKK